MDEQQFYSSLHGVQLSLSRVETDLKHIQEDLNDFKESGKSLPIISSRLQTLETEHTIIKRALIFLLAILATYVSNRAIGLLFPNPTPPQSSLMSK